MQGISRQTRATGVDAAHEVRGASGGTASSPHGKHADGSPWHCLLFLGWDKLFGLWKRLFLHKTGFYHLIENNYPMKIELHLSRWK